MSFFSTTELGTIQRWAGQKVKNSNPTDLQSLYDKLHKICGLAIMDLPYTKENVDKRTLSQAAGKGKGFIYKDYLWVKVFYNPIGINERAFFNLTLKKNNNLELSIDYSRKVDSLADCFSRSTEAKNIHSKSKDQLDLTNTTNNDEDSIKRFIRNYINAHIRDIIDFNYAMYVQQCVTLLDTNYNLILTGAPGTGKTYLAKDIAQCFTNGNLKKQFGFVQFHPSYDYTDFMEGLRPKNLTGGSLGFERRDGVFKAFCSKAALDNNPDNKYVFVIDEINRGEVSKIFGELFFSIDSGYRGEFDVKKNNDNKVKTQYQNLITAGEKWKDEDGNDTNLEYPFIQGFYVPKNVYLIGTMNDIDRSVESMDFAFRRRFAFKEIAASDTQLSILNNSSFKEEAVKRMNNLNKAIGTRLGSAYHIGASYFLKIDDYKGNWDNLWENHLRGVLYEYLRGLPDSQSVLDSWKKEYDK